MNHVKKSMLQHCIYIFGINLIIFEINQKLKFLSARLAPFILPISESAFQGIPIRL